MKLGGRARMDDGAALEDLFEALPVSPNFTVGLLAAIATGPETIPSAAWLPEILGADAAGPGRAAKVELLERLFVAAGETLREAPEIICPEPDKPAEEAFDFCTGYLRGAALQAAWQADPVAAAKLAPFALLVAKDVDEAAAKTARAELGTHVAAIHAHFQAKRQVVHQGPKVGRNDPCPCGSGKKHKKCCLAA